MRLDLISDGELLAGVTRRCIGDIALAGSQLDSTESETSLTEIFALQPELILEKGEALRHADEYVCMLGSGIVASHLFTARGERNIQYIYKPGDVFPVQTVFGVKPKSDIIYGALGYVTYRSLTRDRFEEFLRSNPSVALGVEKQIVEQLSLLSERIDILQQRRAYDQVAYQIAALAVRFGRSNEQIWSISSPIGHQEIADLLGLTRETTSRMIGHLKRDGLVSYNKWHQLVVPDLGALKNTIGDY